MTAAPEKTSSLLELAASLHPDCADALQAVVEAFDGKNVVDDKNGPLGAPPAPDRTVADGGTPDPNGLNLDDPQVRDINSVVGGFDPGFGPGFPGAPGFVGSPPAAAWPCHHPLPRRSPPWSTARNRLDPPHHFTFSKP